MVKEIVIALMIGATAPIPKTEYVDLGECRITTYCPECNDGEGYESSSGTELEYGHCACNWLPVGTKINIEGEPFVVVDTCGTDAIDIFIDTDDCWCNVNEYRKVVVVNENNEDSFADMVDDCINESVQYGVD